MCSLEMVSKLSACVSWRIRFPEHVCPCKDLINSCRDNIIKMEIGANRLNQILNLIFSRFWLQFIKVSKRNKIKYKPVKIINAKFENVEKYVNTWIASIFTKNPPGVLQYCTSQQQLVRTQGICSELARKKETSLTCSHCVAFYLTSIIYLLIVCQEGHKWPQTYSGSESRMLPTKS